MRKLDSIEVYSNAWMTVREDRIERADGSAGIYGVVDKPTFALVIPFDGECLHLVEQFRYPVGMRRWEFVQGTAPDRTESPVEELAQRELVEETGLCAAQWDRIGELHLAAGLSSQRGVVFLATELEQGECQREHEEQDMVTGAFTIAEFEQMARTGVITDSQTLAAYAQFHLWRQT